MKPRLNAIEAGCVRRGGMRVTMQAETEYGKHAAAFVVTDRLGARLEVRLVKTTHDQALIAFDGDKDHFAIDPASEAHTAAPSLRCSRCSKLALYGTIHAGSVFCARCDPQAET